MSVFYTVFIKTSVTMSQSPNMAFCIIRFTCMFHHHEHLTYKETAHDIIDTISIIR